MNCDQDDNSSVPRAPDDESRSAVNSLILDYYKKFGRKRDLEQYFSLSTAQSDIRDPSSLYWARMKAENESSDSGEKSDNKKSDSSQELCRISIRFPAQEPSSSQDDDSKTKTESTSPPIIIEELPQDSRHGSEEDATKSEDDALKSDDNSQKSYDVLLDTSLNKLHSPSSSVTSQRKLEWDSLADVGYANESDRKTSASSLSTLERLALKQQYSNNDSQQSNLGVPTAHSTPLDENNGKSKNKKGVGKKTTKIYKKDVDVLELNVPHSSNMNPAQSINVNLTKHISFNVEKDGRVTVDNLKKDISVSPEKIAIATVAPAVSMDREIQTTLPKASNSSPDDVVQQNNKIPIMISLNTLKSRVRRRRLRMARRKLKTKKRVDKDVPVQEKSGEQLSEAESFEYMPGHIYNQNQMTATNRPINTDPPAIADNKSSLESSGILTSDSSKGTRHSFTKDLEKSIDLLKSALNQRCDDSALRKQLIQQVCKRLLSSRYRDDESTTDFLSGLSFSSKKLGLGDRSNTTTSTSDANNSTEKSQPKKSILRTDKFNPRSIASTSQSVPNLPVASTSDNIVTSNLAKNLTSSNTESDMSSKEKTSSDNGHPRTSSEELYKKYLQALKKEEAYRKHLKDKEMFMKQKLVCSDGAFKVPAKVEVKPSSNRLKDLIHDLTRNNYDDGSGDASKLEGGPGSHRDSDRYLPNKTQRSHSVFTLSSGISEALNKKANFKKKIQSDMKDLSKPGPSKESHYCCCPHHSNLKFADSSVQVNIKNACTDQTCPARRNKGEKQKLESPKRTAKIISDDKTGNFKYVCLCNKNIEDAPEDFLIYKCSRLSNKGVQLGESSSKSSNDAYVQCNNETCKRDTKFAPSTVQCLNNKSSQTNMLIKMLTDQPTNSNLVSTGDQKHIQLSGEIDDVLPLRSTTTIYEATRWIQTEISINPKISEPTLSDINIVSEFNCARLISEHYREVPKSSTDMSSNRAVASISASSDSDKSTGTSKGIANKEKYYDETEKKRRGILNQDSNNIEQSENITIPIQGTNMTLMVSIGSERTDFPNRGMKEMVTECIGTDKVKAIEQATSLREECSKGVQFDKMSHNSSTVDHNKNKVSINYANKDNVTNIETNETPLLVNACLSTEDTKFGTYPQTSPSNERNPFRRTNTDADKVQCVTFTHDVGGGKRNTNTKISSRSNDKSSEYNLNLRELCPCGCKTNKDDCNADCSEKKPSDLTSQSQSQKKSTCGHQTMCGHTTTPDDMSDPQFEKCLCGCGGTKNTCKKSCKESKISTKRQCGIQLEQTSTQTNFSLERNDRCECGCGGAKNTCNKSCKELGTSPRSVSPENRRECERYPINRQISSQTNTELSRKNRGCGDEPVDTQTEALIQNDRCFCGCGGVKNFCKKSCKELRASSRHQSSPLEQQYENNVIGRNKHSYANIDLSVDDQGCGKRRMDKEIDIQTESSINESDKCLCGCGGTKTFCKKSCRGKTSSPRIKDLEKKRQYLTEMNIQTDTEKIDKRQLLDRGIEIQTDEKCSCGCGGFKDYCLRNCKGRKSSPNNNGAGCGGPVNKKIDARRDTWPIQTDVSSSRKDVNCIRRDSSPIRRDTSPIKKDKSTFQTDKASIKRDTSPIRRDNSPTRKENSPTRKDTTTSSRRGMCGQSDRKIDTETDYLLSRNEKCHCGCGNEKSKCKKSCSELQSSTGHKGVGNKCGSRNKEMDIQTDMALDQIETCPCGCGGTKDNCGQDCIELKLTPRRQPKMQDQTVYSESYGPNVNNDKCSCGCGGTKSTCKRTCKESRLSPRQDKIQNEVGTQKQCDESPSQSTKYRKDRDDEACSSHNTKYTEYRDNYNPAKKTENNVEKPDIRSSDNSQKSSSENDSGSDPILNLIQSITKKYSKNEIEKNKRKKCFKEIMTVLNYLLDTDDSPDAKEALKSRRESTTTADDTEDSVKKESEKKSCEKTSRKLVDKGVQPSVQKPKSNPCATESSETPTSTDVPGTSSDSAACKVLNKIKKECEKYHQKRCKFHSGKNCDGSSTSINCDQCRRIHYCQCRSHKCKNHKKCTEKLQKSPVAYNLILQTSESVMSEGPSSCEKTRTLKNIIVKVPKKKHSSIPFRELAAKFEKQMSHGPIKEARCCRSNSLPNDSEMSSMDEIIRQSQGATVREYLEKNRPDFIEKCSQRQTCMRYITESRANERAVKRDMLSLQLAQLPDVTELDSDGLRRLAADLGRYMRDRRPAPKLISEREMKQHSEKIYKSLPEVIQKKEEKRKENIKKANLLMANMFKRNLQKKTLRGSVNLSHYTSVIKI